MIYVITNAAYYRHFTTHENRCGKPTDTNIFQLLQGNTRALQAIKAECNDNGMCTPIILKRPSKNQNGYERKYATIA